MLFIFLSVLQMKHYKIKWMLGYETFLLDSEIIWKDILSEKKRKNMLDVGAWNGWISEKFYSYIKDISFIEPSTSFQKILKRKGFNEHKASNTYEVVGIFNVLDICRDPKEILIQAKKSLAKNGIIVISLPFPIWTRSWDIKDIKKDNHLGQTKEMSFEEWVSLFYRQFLKKSWLSVIKFTRLPYLVSTAEYRDVTVYDNALFVCHV